MKMLVAIATLTVILFSAGGPALAGEQEGPVFDGPATYEPYPINTQAPSTQLLPWPGYPLDDRDVR